MSSLSGDHYRSVHVVQYGLRDASEKKAAEGPESAGSENDEVDVAAVRNLHDLPRRIAFRDQSLDGMSSAREYCDRVGQHRISLSVLLPSRLVELVVRK